MRASTSDTPLRILSFSSLYPNTLQPRHGIFVENRLKHLIEHYPVELTVVAPVPWFPFKAPCFGQYAVYAQVPAQEQRHNIQVYHPRYPVIPKIGMNLTPELMFQATRGLIKQLHQQHRFQLIDSHYIYPDGVCAVKLAQMLNLPVTMTARGNDITLCPQYRKPRRMIRHAIDYSDAVISVCQFLANEIDKLDIHQPRNLVMRNGVDLQRFTPKPREAIRQRLKLDKFTLIAVGHFIERKGQHLIIEALRELPDVQLLLIGDGPMQDELQRLIHDYQLQSQVNIIGALPQTELADYYSAADCMVLASSREGWANVLLEAMACGTPVIATRVSGTPEVVLNDTAGQLITRSPQGIIAGLQQLRANYPQRQAVRHYAEQFSWDQTSASLYQLFCQLID